MTEPGDERYPPIDDPAYELRFTLRAMADLGCPEDLGPGDIGGIAGAIEQRFIVKKFAALRGNVPTGTDAPMRDVGRPDVYDEDASVCWLLAWVPQHDYAQLEVRAANDELLPGVDDYTVLELEREEVDLAHLVRPGLVFLRDEAVAFPGVPVRRTIGGLLQMEVTAEVVELDEGLLADVHLTVRFPPLADPPHDWPGAALPDRLAELFTGASRVDLEIEHVTEIPDDGGGERTVDLVYERAIVIRGWSIPS